MSDLMMNTHTCVSHSINYIMSYVRSICLIQWWMYTHVLIIAILAPCCLSDQYVSINNVCTHMFYWKHYLHRGMVYVGLLCQMECWMYTHVLLIKLLTPCYISMDMSYLVMNKHTFVTDNTTYTICCMSDHLNSNCNSH